jgi:antitoxin (DNA-binding transcriptional repressor) of toxin-antitoxin stability system
MTVMETTSRNLAVGSHRVRKTGEPILVTRFGHPIAEIVAPGALKPVRRLGTMAGTGRIIGDIVGPIGDESDWDVAKE